ncbi:DUF6297 family protein [Zhihengliuella halotolerans]|uniref:ABC-2 type transport system permease protein n=1 Tax=Zhihengliuella halotolerans TaxID=370736 RepID=A0A4Q8AG16_9MICC|nr:DUF6297 family protein [Zhihengliuella halotolerans]RZU63290.1 hypothetical protein EV380_2902 [Zhihengliuella halotolerans]
MRPTAVGATFDPWAFTRAIERRAQTENRWDRLGDLYLYALALLLLLAFVAGAVVSLREELRTGGHALVDVGLVSQQTAFCALALWGTLHVARLMITLGPLGATRAQAAWWFPLPVSRRPVLRRIATRRFLSFFAAGAVAWLPFGLAAGEASSVGYEGPPGSALLAGSAAAGLLVMTTAVGAALVQAFGIQRIARRALTAAAVLAMVGLAAEALVGAVSGEPPASVAWAVLPSSLPLQLGFGEPAGSSAPAGICALLLASGLGWIVVDRRLEHFEVAELVRAGAVSAHAAAALETMEYRQAAVALHQGPSSATRRGARLLAAAWGRGAAAALVAADAVVLLRSRAILRSAVVSLALPGLMMVVDGGNSVVPLALAGAVSVGVMVHAAATPVRVSTGTRGLPELLPLGAGAVGRVRTIVPAILLIAWGALFGTFFGAAVLGTGGSLAMSAVIGAATGWGLSGAAVKSAGPQAQPIDELFAPGAELQASSAALGRIGRGYGLAVIALMPLGLYLSAGQLWALPVAVAVGGFCWWAGASTGTLDR